MVQAGSKKLSFFHRCRRRAAAEASKSCFFAHAPGFLINYCTLKIVVPVTPFLLPAMVEVPALTPLATPFELMVATEGFEESHDT